MFINVTLGINNGERAKPFWAAVAADQNFPIFMDHPHRVAYGEPSGPKTCVRPTIDEQPATHGNCTHVDVLAKSRKVFDSFYKTVIEYGTSDEGSPDLRPQYHPNYYGAYVRNPDSNKLQAICHSLKG